jgi:hypothetical protein
VGRGSQGGGLPVPAGARAQGNTRHGSRMPEPTVGAEVETVAGPATPTIVGDEVIKRQAVEAAGGRRNDGGRREGLKTAWAAGRRGGGRADGLGEGVGHPRRRAALSRRIAGVSRQWRHSECGTGGSSSDGLGNRRGAQGDPARSAGIDDVDGADELEPSPVTRALNFSATGATGGRGAPSLALTTTGFRKGGGSGGRIGRAPMEGSQCAGSCRPRHDAAGL